MILEVPMFRAIAISALFAIGMAGCTSTPEAPQHLAAKQDTCWVCVQERDLACMKVDVDDKTPKAGYDGKTYYVWSEECKKNFVAHPAKYVKLASAAAPTQ